MAVKQIFDPIIDKIIALVENQVRGVEIMGKKVSVSHACNSLQFGLQGD